MGMFSRNAKMRKSSKVVYNFGIPAFQSATGLRTCPNAGICAAGCYARSGAYRFSNVQRAYEDRLKLTQLPDFKDIASLAIHKLALAHKDLYIRVHDSGDFYSPEYQIAWYAIARAFPTVNFYAYTKQIAQSNLLQSDKPDNFRLIYSYGGLQDNLITEVDRRAKVFETLEDLSSAGYIDASNDDMLALTDNVKVGLIYHGNKNYENTKWNGVETKSRSATTI